MQEDEPALFAGGTDGIGVDLGGHWDWIGRFGVLIRQRRHCGGWMFQSQEKAEPRGDVTFGGMPQAEIADFVESPGQDVLQEAAHERFAGEAAGTPPSFLALLEAEGDARLVHGLDAVVGDGDAEGVTGQIVEDGLLAPPPRDAMDHPVPPANPIQPKTGLVTRAK